MSTHRIGKTKNGTEDIRWIDKDQDCPRLSWELIEAEAN